MLEAVDGATSAARVAERGGPAAQPRKGQDGRVKGEVHGVLFDAGGVLVMPDPKVVGSVLEALSLDASQAACHRLHYERAHLADTHAPAEWTVVDYHLAVALGFSEEAADRAARLFSSTFGNHRSVVAAEARQVLHGLHALGKTLGIVSNSDGTLAARLAEDAVCSEDGRSGSPVAFVIDSAVVGVAKPSLRIFQLAVQRLGALGVDHKRCLFVGDTVSNDAHPAAHIGFIPVHLDPYELCRDHDHRHISSLQ